MSRKHELFKKKFHCKGKSCPVEPFMSRPLVPDCNDCPFKNSEFYWFDIQFYALMSSVEFFLNLTLSERERLEKIPDEAQIIVNRIEEITPMESAIVSEKLRKAHEDLKQLEESEKVLGIACNSIIAMHAALAKEGYVTKLENEDIVKDEDIMKESFDKNIAKERLNDLRKMYT